MAPQIRRVYHPRDSEKSKKFADLGASYVGCHSINSIAHQQKLRQPVSKSLVIVETPVVLL